MNSTSPPVSSASVRNILTLLASRDAQLVAGTEGLERRVTWASRMRARLPAFESVRGGELALLGLSQLRRLDETLPHLLQSLHKEGIAAVAVAAPSIEVLGTDAENTAQRLHLPLIFLPASAPLEEIEREVITFVVSFRGEIERRATEVSHQLMQLSAQGVGIQGISEQLARTCGKWTILEDAEHTIRHKAPPSPDASPEPPDDLSDGALQLEGLIRIVVPILIRHDVVGYLSLVSQDNDFDYQERILLGQVAPILALEFMRERERSEVEGRYQTEALMDVLQGNYPQSEAMLTRARLLGHDLTLPQAVVLFELAASESEYGEGHSTIQWGRRMREELLRTWPTCWAQIEGRRVTVLLPVEHTDHETTSERESEQSIFARLERVNARVAQSSTGSSSDTPAYSGGIGRIAKQLSGIPQSMREAQQALEIGRRLFREGQLHSFSQLGVYRLLFHLYGHEELSQFYQETLGPLLDHDSRSNVGLIETLEGYFRCNCNLSETARAMNFHRNSLLYRLARIEELLGRSLEDAELRLSLQIALKIRHVLHKN